MQKIESVARVLILFAVRKYNDAHHNMIPQPDGTKVVYADFKLVPFDYASSNFKRSFQKI